MTIRRSGRTYASSSRPSELAEAIAAGTLNVAFQPLVELRGGGVARLEALCRWPHGTGGEVPPWHFIPRAQPPGPTPRPSALGLHGRPPAPRHRPAERP